jgi:hypothetical protein
MEKLSESVTAESSGVRLESLSQAQLTGFTARFVEEVTQESKLFKSRVENKAVAMVNPDAKKRKPKKPPAKVPLSSREKRRLGLNEIPLDCRKYHPSLQLIFSCDPTA